MTAAEEFDKIVTELMQLGADGMSRRMLFAQLCRAYYLGSIDEKVRLQEQTKGEW